MEGVIKEITRIINLNFIMEVGGISVDKRFRGKISNEKNEYYIVNEISRLPYMTTLSAVKLVKNENSSIKFEKEIFCLVYFDKKYIEQVVFGKKFENEEEIQFFYQNLKLSFIKYTKVKREYILELFDYIETQNGIFYVMEFYDHSLHDYLLELRQEKFIKQKNCEILFRPFIITTLTAIASMHEESLNLCGLIDQTDIYIKKHPNHHTEIKFLHPLLSDLLTLLKIYSNHPPSFFAPEIYQLFQQKQTVLKQLNYYHSFETVRTILKAFPNFIFDYWSAGVLFFEMLFGKTPFRVSCLDHFEEDLNEDKTYEMEWAIITEKIEKIITGCLIFKVEKRLNGGLIDKILRDLIKENSEDVKKEILEKSKAHGKEKKSYSLSY